MQNLNSEYILSGKGFAADPPLPPKFNYLG